MFNRAAKTHCRVFEVQLPCCLARKMAPVCAHSGFISSGMGEGGGHVSVQRRNYWQICQHDPFCGFLQPPKTMFSTVWHLFFPRKGSSQTKLLSLLSRKAFLPTFQIWYVLLDHEKLMQSGRVTVACCTTLRQTSRYAGKGIKKEN